MTPKTRKALEMAQTALNSTYPERDDRVYYAKLAITEALAEPAPLHESLDVRKIMLDIVPGDGSGHEVYATCVADVERKLSEMGEQLENWELGIKRLPAPRRLTDADIAMAWLATNDPIALGSKFENSDAIRQFARAIEAQIFGDVK